MDLAVFVEIIEPNLGRLFSISQGVFPAPQYVSNKENKEVNKFK